MKRGKRQQRPTFSASTFEPGDPRWEAWLKFLTQQGSPEVGAIARQRRPLTATSDWPPESAEVYDGGRLFSVPWGTPEHAAWLAHWRRTGMAQAAQSADISQRQLIVSGRWPPLAAPAAAGTGKQPCVA